MPRAEAPHQVLLFPQFQKKPESYERFLAACQEQPGISGRVVVEVPWGSQSTADWELEAAAYADKCQPEQGSRRTIVTDGLGLLAARTFLDEPVYPYDAIVAINPPLACAEARNMTLPDTRRGVSSTVVNALLTTRLDESDLFPREFDGLYDALSSLELLTHPWWNQQMTVIYDRANPGRQTWAKILQTRKRVMLRSVLQAADPLQDNPQVVADIVARFVPNSPTEEQ